MCLAEGPLRSDTGEAQTRGPSVSSQALYHWPTAPLRVNSEITSLDGVDLEFSNIVINLWSTQSAHIPCADPENFVRGGPTLTGFF